MAYYPNSHMARQAVLNAINSKTMEVIRHQYFKVTKGRFNGSVGRMVKADVAPANSTGSYHADAIYLIFEPDGRPYKLDVADYYNGSVATSPVKDDSGLVRIDSKDKKDIPDIRDRYGLEIKIKSMVVCHTQGGLKVGIVKSITPAGTIRFNDFDAHGQTFTKSVYIYDSTDKKMSYKSNELMVIGKELMEQMMVRKLSR